MGVQYYCLWKNCFSGWCRDRSTTIYWNMSLTKHEKSSKILGITSDTRGTYCISFGIPAVIPTPQPDNVLIHLVTEQSHWLAAYESSWSTRLACEISCALKIGILGKSPCEFRKNRGIMNYPMSLLTVMPLWGSRSQFVSSLIEECI